MKPSNKHPLDNDLPMPGQTDLDDEIAASGVPIRVFTDPDDGSRVAVFAPSGIRLTTIDQARALRDVQGTYGTVMKHRLLLDAQVAAAREAGLSWAAIGFSCGMTSEGARTRWSD